MEGCKSGLNTIRGLKTELILEAQNFTMIWATALLQIISKPEWSNFPMIFYP